MCVPSPLTSSSLVGRYFSTQGTSKSIELEEIGSFNARKSLERCGDGWRLVRSSLKLGKQYGFCKFLHKSGPWEFHHVVEAFVLV